MAEQDYFDLSLEELSKVRISVASPFPEDYLGASSSVSIITAQDWSRRGARDPAGVMETLPSVMSYSSLGAHAIAIRGFSQSSSVRGIATLLDGVPLNGYTFGSALYDKFQWDLDGLQRIQVIRGPSSALYGSDAFHGVIAMESYNASQDEQSASGHLGSDGYWQSGWRASQGLEHGWRVNGSIGASEKSDENRGYDYTDPATGQPGSSNFDYRNNSQSAILKLDAPTEGAGDYALGLYSNRYTANGHPGIGQYYPAGQSAARNRDFSDADTGIDLLKTSGKWLLTQGSELEGQLYHWQSTLEHHTDRTLASHAIQLTRDNEQRSGAQLNYKTHLASNTDWLLSGSADHLSIDEKRNRSIAPSGALLLETREADGQSRNIYGLVNQFKTHLLQDRLTLVYGGRYDEFSDVGDKFTPRLGAIVQPDEHQAVKLLYGRAFRAPTAVELYGISSIRGNKDLKPETIDTYELVYMRQGDGWRTELVGFFSQWENGIMQRSCASPVCTTAPFYQYQNIASSEARGLEWINALQHGPWQLRGTLNYTESFAENATNNSRTRYGAFPRWIAHLDLGYRWESGLEAYLANTFHQGATEGAGGSGPGVGTQPLDDYWRSDLHLAKAIGPGTELSADLRNLLNRENRTPGLWNTENGLEDEARSLTIGISHDF